MSKSIFRIDSHRIDDLDTGELEAIEKFCLSRRRRNFYIDTDLLKELKSYITPELHTALKDELKKKGDFNFIIS